MRHYDASGNVSRGYQQVGGIGTSGDAVIAREVESRSFYGADDRLRMFQTYAVRRTEWSNCGARGGVVGLATESLMNPSEAVAAQPAYHEREPQPVTLQARPLLVPAPPPGKPE